LGLVIVPEDANRSTRFTREPDDRVDRGRFSRAVGPEKSEELSLSNAQRNVVDGGEVTVTLDESFDFDGV
jgi:hypothetical protein